MAEITAALVKDLREKTGAGMMDCKSALVETKGDVEAAVDWLRTKGLAKAAKKSGRVAAEGLVAVALAGTKGVVVEVNSETDFVARNEQFQALVSGIAKIALNGSTDTEKLNSSSYPTGGTVAETIANTIATIGENMTLRRAAALSVNKGVVASYIHGSVADGLGKIAVIVALESEGDVASLSAFGRQVAMHIAAANPQALDAASMAPDLVARERAVLAEKAAASGKPANVVEKIVDSGIKTFYKEVCLVDQQFIHDSSKTVTQAAGEAGKAAGATITITGYVRFALGEGIEKETSDFADEVKKAGGQA